MTQQAEFIEALICGVLFMLCLMVAYIHGYIDGRRKERKLLWRMLEEVQKEREA